MIDVKKSRIQMFEEWLHKGGYLFKTSNHGDDECVFIIDEDAVNQTVLQFEMTINNNNAEVSILCCVAPGFPQHNLEMVDQECKKLSYIYPFEFHIIDESVNVVCEFEAETNKDFICEIIGRLLLFKKAVDDSIPHLMYTIWNAQGSLRTSIQIVDE